MADKHIEHGTKVEQQCLDLFSGFCEYDEKFPQIWRAFKNYTFRTIDKGHKRSSAKRIFEIIRWDTGVNAEYPEGFKVNNNYTAYYARKFMEQFPKYKDFFITRKSKFDKY